MKLFLIGLALLLAACGGGGDPKPPHRTDIQYTYYGTYGNQVEEVRDSTNWAWQAFWEGDAKAFDDIASAAKPTTIDMTRMFERTGPKQMALRQDAYDIAYDLFDHMRRLGVLQHVAMIVPMDEPNLPEHQVCKYLPEAVRILRDVATHFEDLRYVKLGVIYYANTAMCHTELFDILGFDDYPAGSNILAPDGSYERFRARLRPDQRTMLIVGGSYGQEPGPFVEYAHRNPEVFAIVSFLWRYPMHGEDIKDIVTQPALREKYVAAGRAILAGP